MKSEFETRLSLLELDKVQHDKIKQLIEDAAKEFPCATCPSKAECTNFKWFLKWFGEDKR
jgi:hypothetical protein